MAEPTGDSKARGTLGTVRNAATLLDLLSDGPAYQHLNDLAERSGLSVATVHRLLRSLVLADLVEQDPRSARYGLGPGATRLSERYLGRLPVLGALSPYLVRLRDTTGLTVQVALLVRGSAVYVDRVDGRDSGLYRDAHRVRPALATAAGRILAASAPEEAWTMALHSADAELADLAHKEREAWQQASFLHAADASAVGEPELAVRVPDGRGSPAAALAAALPLETVATEEGAPRVAEVARQLAQAATAAGRTLGHE